MYVEFDALPDEARLWIYQANRKLSDDEVQKIAQDTLDFISTWTAHEKPLVASFLIKYNRFLILGIDASIQPASGCAIDKSVAFIQALEQQFSIDLLDKMNVTYKQGDFIAHKSLLDFKKMAKEKAVNKETIVFNNLVNTKQEFIESWEVPAQDSWHSRFF